MIKFFFYVHTNILDFQSFQVPPDMLCNLAREKSAQYLYRKNILSNQQQSQCPKIFTKWGVSYNITYQESTLESGSYTSVQNCGQPRSELNSCFRKQLSEPQFSLTLGPCPDSVLVHRISLTQNLQCVGTFSKFVHIKLIQ